MSLVARCLRGSAPVARSQSRIRLKARENKSGEIRAANIAVVHASAGPRTPPGKQREERRAEWKTQRRQCPVVPPRKPPQPPRSSQAAPQPAASEPGPSTPLPAKRSKRTKAEPEAAEPTKGKGKAAKAKPTPQPGRWLDRDCNAALNMQRIGESKWRPLELCYWPDQGKLPAKGKEYPGLAYKRLRDKPPRDKAQPAAAQ
ncbi:hypothetical protein HaLaN_07302 [Haematococcus lacustris]|uniref:Uncharacterized protein n=1 Tax=Haematococcus lacustris TaxID=44745 RepID=A0A699YP52_HAELA|nr:hypothetical protein HaLaN_07302 [Haematococcus lacustris]